MRVILFILLLIPISSFADSTFWLEQLTDNASKYTASPELQNAMASATETDFKDCQSQLKLSKKKSSKYFSAIPINISNKNTATFLVFPSQYCYAFFGAHSIQFWVISKNSNNSYNILLSARQDGVEILTDTTNDYANLKVHYNSEQATFYFDGKSYNEKQ